VFNMYQATAHSVNTYFAQLAVDVGIERAIEVARKMGISNIPPPGTEEYDRHWNVCSLVLGVAGVSVLDMASAYGVLANNGVRCPAYSIARIDGPDRKLFEHKSSCTRVIEPKIAAQVTAMLQGVVTGGTGVAAALPGRPVAGKTGTAQEYRSAFFNGYTPQMATSVWVGFTPKPVPMSYQNGGRPVYGGTFPAMVFHDYMTAALDGAPVEGFPAAPPPPKPPTPPTTTPPTTTPPGTSPPPTTNPPGTRDVIVPGVVGLPAGAARAVLTTTGLSSGLAYTNRGRPGRVAAQSPGAGDRLPRGSSVTLVVGRRG
jgi:penicillin-binding protein 1A